MSKHDQRSLSDMGPMACHSVRLGDYIEWASGFTSAMPNKRAAHCLAAAPELLEACKAALAFIGSCSDDDEADRPITQSLRAAIAKVEGGAA